MMIECHAFNSLVRLDERHSGPYILSQFIGGMASVLFLFLAGITFAFQMDSLDRRGAGTKQRAIALLRRAGFVLAVAFLFRLGNSPLSWNSPPWSAIFKVDILNCMGASMLLAVAAGFCGPRRRTQWAMLAGLTVACASPLVSAADWSGVHWLLRNYVVPDRRSFPLFPWSAYLAFGLAAGTVLRRLAPERIDRSLQWAVLLGFGLVIGGQYFSSVPWSVYRSAEFWLNSPGLVIIRVGVVLLILAAAYLYTEYGAGCGWSWMQALGKTSLLVYWVHIAMVYGRLADPLKKALSIPQALGATVLVTALMVLLAAARLRWSARKRAAAVAPVPAAALKSA